MDKSKAQKGNDRGAFYVTYADDTCHEIVYSRVEPADIHSPGQESSLGHKYDVFDNGEVSE